MPSQLLRNRPDIRQAEQQLIAANARIGVAKGQYFPTISLTGLYGSASANLSDLFTESAARGEIFNVGLPFAFDPRTGQRDGTLPEMFFDNPDRFTAPAIRTENTCRLTFIP